MHQHQEMPMIFLIGQCFGNSYSRSINATVRLHAWLVHISIIILCDHLSLVDPDAHSDTINRPIAHVPVDANLTIG